MLRVLGAPVRSQMLADRPHFAGQAGDEQLLRFLQLAVDFSGAINAADGFHACPTSEHFGIFRHGQHRDFSRLLAVAVLLGRFAMPHVGVLFLERLNDRLL